MAERLPENALHQYVPIDTPSAVARFLDYWRPDLALFVESEFWPNLVLQTRKRGIPMALVNARLSERSYRGWLRLQGLARRMMSSSSGVLNSRCSCSTTSASVILVG